MCSPPPPSHCVHRGSKTNFSFFSWTTSVRFTVRSAPFDAIIAGRDSGLGLNSSNTSHITSEKNLSSKKQLFYNGTPNLLIAQTHSSPWGFGQILLRGYLGFSENLEGPLFLILLHFYDRIFRILPNCLHLCFGGTLTGDSVNERQ